MKKSFTIIILTTVFLVSVAFAHSGGTNTMGCHNDHSDGTYHCH